MWYSCWGQILFQGSYSILWCSHPFPGWGQPAARATIPVLHNSVHSKQCCEGPHVPLPTPASPALLCVYYWVLESSNGLTQAAGRLHLLNTCIIWAQEILLCVSVGLLEGC